MIKAVWMAPRCDGWISTGLPGGAGKADMAMTADLRAQAGAGKEVTVGHRAHTARHGQGLWARRQNHVADQCPGGEALAGLR